MVILALAFSAASLWPGHAESPAVRNCTWCHAGQGYGPAPRLAGQQAQYIEKEIMDFRAHIRDNPFSMQYMWGATAALSPETAHSLAIYFSELLPQAADDGMTDIVATGRSMYQDGIAESDIVACVACHGPNGEGVGEIPRLGGLAYPYLKRRLEQWGEGYHATAAPMPPIARRLSAAEIDALASYLSFLK
jgi:cytochrome c553